MREFKGGWGPCLGASSPTHCALSFFLFCFLFSLALSRRVLAHPPLVHSLGLLRRVFACWECESMHHDTAASKEGVGMGKREWGGPPQVYSRERWEAGCPLRGAAKAPHFPLPCPLISVVMRSVMIFLSFSFSVLVRHLSKT